MMIPVDEVPAGPAMDAAVAEALGCNVVVKRYKGRWVAFCNCKLCEHDSSGMLSRYSTDIAAAWEMWHQLAEQFFCVRISITMTLICRAWLFHSAEAVQFADPTIKAVGETAPLAICRAFLKAKGVEYIEVPE